MGLNEYYKQLSFGRQLQILFIICALFLCIILIIITKLQLDWLRSFLIIESEQVLNDIVIKQLRALGAVQSYFLSNEIQNYMAFVSSNKYSAEMIHNFTENLENPLQKTKSYIHSEAVGREYGFGVYYSRNPISDEGWRIIHEESCFNHFYPLKSRIEFLAYYQGYETDEIFWQYPGLMMKSTYTPLVREWYYKAYQSKRALIITEPYVDYNTGMFVITVSQAILKKDNKPFGVTALDVTLEQITGSVVKIKILENGFAILVSRAGMILTLPQFWKPEVKTDVTVKIFDKTYTGLDYQDWEKIKKLNIGSTYAFVDSRGVSLVLIKQEVRPYFDIKNLTHYFFICVESSELNKVKDYTIESFDETYKVLFWISISIGSIVFAIISFLIYDITKSYSIQFKIIEKNFREIVDRALFYGTTINVDFSEFDNNWEGMKKLNLQCQLKIEHIKELENKFLKFDHLHTRPNDVFLYEKVDDHFYPYNHYKDLVHPWMKTLDYIKDYNS